MIYHENGPLVDTQWRGTLSLYTIDHHVYQKWLVLGSLTFWDSKFGSILTKRAAEVAVVYKYIDGEEVVHMLNNDI